MTSEKTSLKARSAIPVVVHFFLDNRDTQISRKYAIIKVNEALHAFYIEQVLSKRKIMQNYA